jgi:hypothetical protein
MLFKLRKMSDFLKMLKYNMQRQDFDFCACGGFHYIGKNNYNAFKCKGCNNLFCNGMSGDNLDKKNKEIMESYDKLSNLCEFVECDRWNCVIVYCRNCVKDKMFHCEKCGVSWCCEEHKTCNPEEH